MIGARQIRKRATQRPLRIRVQCQTGQFPPKNVKYVMGWRLQKIKIKIQKYPLLEATSTGAAFAAWIKDAKPERRYRNSQTPLPHVEAKQQT